MTDAADSWDKYARLGGPNKYNARDYKPETNPTGFNADGHPIQLPRMCQDIADVGLEVADNAKFAAAAISRQQAWGSGFLNASGDVAYQSPTSFRLNGPAYPYFAAGEYVACDCGHDGMRYGLVGSVNDTVVAMTMLGGALTTNLVAAYNADAKAIFIANFVDVLAAQAAAAASATAAGGSAAAAAASAVSAASYKDQAAALAAGIGKGYGSEQIPVNGQLGTGAYVDKTYIDRYFTWNPASIPNGSQATLVFSFPGASMGDFVAMSCESDLLGLRLFGYVSATGIMTAVLSNNTGGAIDLPLCTCHARIDKLIPVR
jgi:hypothetical protein